LLAFVAVVDLSTTAICVYSDVRGMAGKITALKQQKRNRDRVSVYIDGRFAFGLPAIVAARLKRGQSLSDAEIEALTEEGAVDAAYNRALNYLSYRPRSKAEVVIYLQRRDVSESQVASVTERLERAGFLDDEAFARFWIENRERFRPRGPRALRYELRNKGVSDAVIEGALASIDTEASAYRAAEKRMYRLAHLDQATFDRKLIEYLARRGFAYDVAREVTARCWAEVTAAG
jgi:regulatory protein